MMDKLKMHRKHFFENMHRESDGRHSQIAPTHPPSTISSSSSVASGLIWLIVVCGNTLCAQVELLVSATATEEEPTVEELRRRCHAALGLPPRVASYLCLEGAWKPLRDGVLVRHYGLVGAKRLRLRLAASADGCLLGGGGESPDLEALIAIRNSNASIAKLAGWVDLETHRDAGKCKGITLNSAGRVIKLILNSNKLTGLLTFLACLYQ
jgi:hypothetical protein